MSPPSGLQRLGHHLEAPHRAPVRGQAVRLDRRHAPEVGPLLRDLDAGARLDAVVQVDLGRVRDEEPRARDLEPVAGGVRRPSTTSARPGRRSSGRRSGCRPAGPAAASRAGRPWARTCRVSAAAETFSRPSRTTLSLPVETVVRPRKLVTSVLSPGTTSTDTRESRSIAAVAASVATVEVEPDV